LLLLLIQLQRAPACASARFSIPRKLWPVFIPIAERSLRVVSSLGGESGGGEASHISFSFPRGQRTGGGEVLGEPLGSAFGPMHSQRKRRSAGARALSEGSLYGTGGDAEGTVS